VFVKAGRPGWAAIVPIYNGWVFFEISSKPGWWPCSLFLASSQLLVRSPHSPSANSIIKLAKRFVKNYSLRRRTDVYLALLFTYPTFVMRSTQLPRTRATKPEQSTTPLHLTVYSQLFLSLTTLLQLVL